MRPNLGEPEPNRFQASISKSLPKKQELGGLGPKKRWFVAAAVGLALILALSWLATTDNLQIIH